MTELNERGLDWISALINMWSKNYPDVFCIIYYTYFNIKIISVPNSEIDRVESESVLLLAIKYMYMCRSDIYEIRLAKSVDIIISYSIVAAYESPRPITIGLFDSSGTAYTSILDNIIPSSAELPDHYLLFNQFTIPGLGLQLMNSKYH